MPIFPLTLHKTCLEQGFFNVTVAFDKYVCQTEGSIDLVIVHGGPEERVRAHVNRSANTNGTARIMGGTRLRDWFLNNFDVDDRVDVDLSSTAEIRIIKSPTHE